MNASYLFFIRTLDPRDGGPPNAVMQVAGAALRAGHTVRIMTTGNLPAAAPRSDWAVAWSQVRSVKRRVVRVGAPSLLVMLRAVPQIHRADRVSIHGPYVVTAVQIAWLCRLLRTPYSIQPHGSLEAYQRSRGSRLKRSFETVLLSPVLRHAAIVLVASDEEAEGARELAPQHAVHVVGLGVATHGLRRVAQREPTKLIFVGRIVEKKRVDLVLAALALLRAEGVNATLSIVGSGTAGFVSELKALAESTGIADYVTWYGHKDSEAAQRILAQSDVLVLQSDNENFGQVVTEALAVGTPTIVSTAVAAKVHVLNANAGYVVRTDSVAEALNALRTLLTTPGLADQLGSNGYRYAQEHLGWGAVFARWTHAWQSTESLTVATSS